MAKEQLNIDDELTNYYTNIYKEIDSKTKEDPYGNYVLSRVKGGQKTVFNKSQVEIRNFDMSFLDAIESVYPAILKIMKDPKRSIRYEEEVVAVEKAKKVTAETVRHLASHTHLIKEIKKNSDVVPSKVLTTYAEEELAIYENRFIKSLVKRIEIFLERRYEVMKVSLDSFETDKLNVSNKFLMSGQEVTVSLDISIKNDLTTNVETTKEQYNRLLYIRDMVQSLKGTEFMRALAKAKDVLPPIMKTNIILHNPDFKLCYGLWLYLDKADGISTNVDIKEKSYRLSKSFEEDINECMTLALTSFIKNRNVKDIYASKQRKQAKPPKPLANDNIELELNIEPERKQLENYALNEVLLSKTAEFFEASMEGLKEAGSLYNESVKVVYRQMLDMLDQIYPTAFQISNDELNTKNLYEQLEYQRRRMMVMKIVRQQKQMNIARMGKEEKRLERMIASLEGDIKKEEEEKRNKALALEEEKRAKRKLLEKQNREIKGHLMELENEAFELDRSLKEEKKAELERLSTTPSFIRNAKLKRGIALVNEALALDNLHEEH